MRSRAGRSVSVSMARFRCAIRKACAVVFEHRTRPVATSLVAGSTALAMLLTAMPLAAFADDVSDRRYSVLYGGNFDDADAHRFSYRLYYHGYAGSWRGKTQSSYYRDEDDVNHWDITNGYPDKDPWPGANARDLLYLSTHGRSNLMTFYSPVRVGDLTRETDQNKAPAVRVAREYVSRVDSLPADAVVVSVRGFAGDGLDPSTGVESDAGVLAAVVEFGHSLDGIPIAGHLADKIVCRLTSEGVFHYRKTWHSVEGIRRGSRSVPIISASDALAAVARDGERILDVPSVADIEEIELVYYAQSSIAGAQALLPAWRIRVSGNDVYVNAVTGRIMID
ncbi:hypothetical protein MX659_04170 [Coriobacteriia bacterium Es71-Z0120]|uniref:hypothetical protein n=1 Tax=Parvivirga hydrogeniphila TaxID=2939460 RepID=UPI002260887B|nr:hypothetical protein [Parvivirga hydrogeniphila]MCL4078795.1 hypothetical protein [Parvivirga hydrogeniphila]